MNIKNEPDRLKSLALEMDGKPIDESLKKRYDLVMLYADSESKSFLNDYLKNNEGFKLQALISILEDHKKISDIIKNMSKTEHD